MEESKVYENNGILLFSLEDLQEYLENGKWLWT